MQTFFTYLYLREASDHTTQNYIPVGSMDLNIHVPGNALGFQFVTADDAEEAAKCPQESIKYLLGSAEQICTLADMKVINENANNDYEEKDVERINLQLMHLEGENRLRQARGLPQIAAYFYLSGCAFVPMFEKDAVLDPRTREVVYPKP